VNHCVDPVCDNDAVLCPGRVICAPLDRLEFLHIDSFVVAIFTFDLVFRALLIYTVPSRLTGVCPSNWDADEFIASQRENRNFRKDPEFVWYEVFVRFWFSLQTLIDIASIVPFYISLRSVKLRESTLNTTGSFIRILRIFRIFHCTFLKDGKSLVGIFTRSFLRSLDALLIVLLIIGMITIVGGCVMYAAEAGTFMVTADYPDGAFFRKSASSGQYEDLPSPVDSIPTAMYWAVITLTTVGYGDITPVTYGGRFIATLAAICGVMCICVPVSVISANFSDEYSKAEAAATERSRLRHERILNNYRAKIHKLSADFSLWGRRDNKMKLSDSKSPAAASVHSPQSGHSQTSGSVSRIVRSVTTDKQSPENRRNSRDRIEHHDFNEHHGHHQHRDHREDHKHHYDNNGDYDSPAEHLPASGAAWSPTQRLEIREIFNLFCSPEKGGI
jgi:voltage-gated potassium channel Kch